MKPKYDVTVKLLGTDGNVFALIAAVTTALRRAGISKKEVDDFRASAIRCHDYHAVLALITRTVRVT